ncbi:MAG: hypothetical protein ACK514_03015 [Bacteroidota bacterium]|jgi:predicted AAA+ superfamily ATPase|nr:hypothetical protein [Cytophagales bacterium]MCE2958908.1 hypothetical protein [Flammeovirgaceae bacterium]MCZ8071066.1 hypothetical protein [Cytophagales bacterium]
MIDKKATTQWEKAAVSYTNYAKYIQSKADKFELTLVDLLYISNFKGGNSTINEDEFIAKTKLKKYSKALREIEAEFSSRNLAELNDKEVKELIEKVKTLCYLTKKNTDSKIDGFSISYLSALANCYFPNLLPILDRRVLINIGIVTRQEIDKQGQIIDIERFYEPLILEMRKKSSSENKTLRQIDKELFVIKIPKEKRIADED